MIPASSPASSRAAKLAACPTEASLLHTRQQGRESMTSEQTKLTAPDAFQVLVFPRPRADGVAAHLGGHVATDAGVQVTGTAFAHGGDDLMGRKDAVCALTTQAAGDGKNFITASHASILPDLPVSQ